MASLFHRHKDRLARPQDDAEARDVPVLPPVLAFPKPEDGEDAETNENLGRAFKAIEDADHSDKTYAESRSLKVLNASGASAAAPVVELIPS